MIYFPEIYRLLLLKGYQIFVTTLKVLEGDASGRYSVTFQNLKGCGQNICYPFLSNNLYLPKHHATGRYQNIGLFWNIYLYISNFSKEVSQLTYQETYKKF